jgi:hypothetical protein
MLANNSNCKSCKSGNQRNLNGEIAIHFPGLKGIDKPIVWVFRKLLVCSVCGFMEFAIPETELQQLAESDSTAAQLATRDGRIHLSPRSLYVSGQ